MARNFCWEFIFCGLASFRVLWELIFTIRTLVLLAGNKFLQFSESPVQIIDNIFVFFLSTSNGNTVEPRQLWRKTENSSSYWGQLKISICQVKNLWLLISQHFSLWCGANLLISSETVKWVGIYMIKRDLFVLLLVFYAYTTRRADRMGSEWSCKNQNSSYRVEFRWLFDQRKGISVRVSGEFELSELEFTK